MADEYEGFSRKDLIKMLEEANDSVEHYEKLCEEKDEEYETMVEEKNEEISDLEERVSELESEVSDLESEQMRADLETAQQKEALDIKEKHNTELRELCDHFVKNHKELTAMCDIALPEKAELIKFIAGNYEAEPAVKEAIKREYSQDFIDGNGERWAEIGIEW